MWWLGHRQVNSRVQGRQVHQQSSSRGAFCLTLSMIIFVCSSKLSSVEISAWRSDYWLGSHRWVLPIADHELHACARDVSYDNVQPAGAWWIYATVGWSLDDQRVSVSLELCHRYTRRELACTACGDESKIRYRDTTTKVSYIHACNDCINIFAAEVAEGLHVNLSVAFPKVNRARCVPDHRPLGSRVKGIYTVLSAVYHFASG